MRLRLICVVWFTLAAMIVIDASPAVHHKAGLGRYAEELIGALVYAKPDVPPQRSGYSVLYHDAANAKPSRLIESLPRVTTVQRPYPWRLRALLAQLLNIAQDGLLVSGDGAAGAPKLFHATEHLLPRFKRARSVFTLHDLIFKFFPAYHLPRNRLFLNLAMPLFLRRADAIICVSEHTKRDAMREYRLPEHKLRVIYEGVHPRFKRIVDVKALQIVRDHYSLPERFVFALGTIEPRKNYPTLIKAFAEMRRRRDNDDTQLIIAGRQGWLFEETFRTVHENGLTGRVRFIGAVDEAHLPALYSLATIFAMPSMYEGFGFPPLEALACGAAVACSTAASLPEIVGNAGVALAPTDVTAWADTLERALTDADFVRGLRARGPAQSAKFSWQNAARETRVIYDEVLAR